MKPLNTSGGLSGIIALAGLSRSGKTTLGKAAAAQLHIPFYDSDALVAVRTGLTPRQLYIQAGKTAFYTAEAGAVQQCVSADDGTLRILALGGGFCDNPAAAALLPPVLPLFLEAPESVLFARMRAEALRNGTYPAFLNSIPAEQEAAAYRVFSALYRRRNAWYQRNIPYRLRLTAQDTLAGSTAKLIALIRSIYCTSGAY